MTAWAVGEGEEGKEESGMTFNWYASLLLERMNLFSNTVLPSHSSPALHHRLHISSR